MVRRHRRSTYSFHEGRSCIHPGRIDRRIHFSDHIGLSHRSQTSRPVRLSEIPCCTMEGVFQEGHGTTMIPSRHRDRMYRSRE